VKHNLFTAVYMVWATGIRSARDALHHNIQRGAVSTFMELIDSRART